MQQHTDDYRKERILDVLEVLELIPYQNTPIGALTDEKGLSGGEFRRLTFASVVLTNPSILLIDEPTSGSTRFLVRRFDVLLSQDSTVIFRSRS